MKASELRIGNIIYVNGVPVNIGYGVIMDMYQKQKGLRDGYLDSLTFNPIHLTEEWLLRLGFKKYKEGFWFNIAVGSYIQILKENDICWLYFNDRQLSGVRCKYVHQLQNLYFALTEEELEIKL